MWIIQYQLRPNGLGIREARMGTVRHERLAQALQQLSLQIRILTEGVELSEPEPQRDAFLMNIVLLFDPSQNSSCDEGNSGPSASPTTTT